MNLVETFLWSLIWKAAGGQDETSQSDPTTMAGNLQGHWESGDCENQVLPIAKVSLLVLYPEVSA